MTERSASEIPLTFIIGTGRCGSTLMHEIFAKHSQSSFVSTIEESNRRLAVLRRWASALYRLDSSPALRRLGNRFRPTEAYGLINRQVSPIYSRPFRDLGADDVTPWLETRFRKFFAQRAVGGRMLVHKYTGWSRVGFFTRIFPQARFVHVVRDGRAVANSWLQMRWWDGYQGTAQWQWGHLSCEREAIWKESDRSHVVLAALCWDMLLESYEASRKKVSSEQYMEIRYEDFVEDPAEHCRSILKFMGLEWSRDFQKHLNGFRIGSSRRTAYADDLLPEQVSSIERCIDTRLDSYGYLH